MIHGMKIEWTPPLEQEIMAVLREHRGEDSILSGKQPHPDLLRQAAEQEAALERAALQKLKAIFDPAATNDEPGESIEISWSATLPADLAEIIAAYAKEPMTNPPQEPSEPWMWLNWEKAERSRAATAVLAIRRRLQQSSVPAVDLDVIAKCEELRAAFDATRQSPSTPTTDDLPAEGGAKIRLVCSFPEVGLTENSIGTILHADPSGTYAVEFPSEPTPLVITLEKMDFALEVPDQVGTPQIKP